MTATTRTEKHTDASGSRRPWRLSGRLRKGVLVVHILAAGAWVGIDVVMGVFVFTALASDSDRTKALSYQALEMFAVWPMTIAGMLCLASGIALGLGSKYGLVRYWWVALKLMLNVLLSTLVLVALRPGVQEAAEQGRRLAAGEIVSVQASDLAFPPIVSPTLLVVAFVLSVYKPWGRIRRSPR